MNKRKLAAAYIFLVGLPLLALLAILRAGSHLVAPVALHGDWRVQADFGAWHGVSCEAPLANSSPPLLSIAQSGTHLTVTLNDPDGTVLAGTIDGFTLSKTPFARRTETELARRRDSGCLAQRSLSLRATVDQQGKKRSLTGTFQLEGCASCPPIAFSATPQMPTQRPQ